MINCKNCNTEFDGAFCPNCGTKAEITAEVNTTVSSEPSAEAVFEPAENVQSTTTVEAPQAFTMPQQTVNTQQTAPQQPSSSPYSQQAVPVQPSKAGLTIKQTINVIKNFFTKNVADSVCAQHGEKLPIWIVLLSLPAVLSAFSGLIHCDVPALDILGALSTPYSIYMGRLGYFVAGILYTALLVASFFTVIYFYGKVIRKKNVTFTGCANLVSSAFLPITVVSAGYLLLGSNVDIAFTVAFVMFIMLLYKGLVNILQDEKPIFWSFMLLIVISLAVYSVASLVLSVPGFINNSVNTSYNLFDSIFNNYNNYSDFYFNY